MMQRSKLEVNLDLALKELFPHDKAHEDFAIKIGKQTLFVDRMLPTRKIAIEVDGRQHDEYIQHFHKDSDGFQASKARDQLKNSWLEANGYVVIRIAYNENMSTKSIRKAILKAINDQV